MECEYGSFIGILGTDADTLFKVEGKLILCFVVVIVVQGGAKEMSKAEGMMCRIVTNIGERT